ncbi:sugar ABC transporter substrate-binding protein [Rubellimicrobium rubrum]|uniref:Sugar ABC transporter substrate-binding protein n=1 Tax=Rubellimicrobium rubrum TaxID=2585369 RepID=A0A5C4MQV9_9RHOB|nr:sugar ABC transporter substrate-binding protein [Rubellimicrobium rubrum]TNC46717.1 sugar ABC transporter substrate-binding protein [Rubellimicrobium rubrum]
MTATMRLRALLAATALVGFATAAAAQDGANIFVVGGKSDDPFWSIVKRGAEDAGLVVQAQGGSVTWLGPQTYDNLGADAADLIRTAISQSPDAIVAPDWVPEAMDDAFKTAVDAGIPVIIYNAGGFAKAEELGAMNYIGSDDSEAGRAGGAYLAEHGAKNVICVNTIPGAASLEARCQGIAEGMAENGGISTQLPLPASSFGNPTAVAEAIKAVLLKDDTVDGLVTISAGDADSAAIAVSQAGVGDRVALGTFDMNQGTLDRIKAGDQLFAIDQQPYLQGYLAVSLLNGYVNYGLDVPTAPILTGPGIVDSSNIEATIAGVAAGAR